MGATILTVTTTVTWFHKASVGCKTKCDHQPLEPPLRLTLYYTNVPDVVPRNNLASKLWLAVFSFLGFVSQNQVKSSKPFCCMCKNCYTTLHCGKMRCLVYQINYSLWFCSLLLPQKIFQFSSRFKMFMRYEQVVSIVTRCCDKFF